MDPNTIFNKIDENESQLCVGLDFREGNKLDLAKQVIEETAEYAVAYKPNRQFWLGYNLKEMQELTRYIKKYNCIAIIDHKLSDIGSSSVEALKYSKKEGFDLITISPYPGNFEEMCVASKEIGIGIIALIMMSNPQAKWMLNSPYLEWAKIANTHKTGIVIGTTNHVTKDIISSISEVFNSGIVLAPGLGTQGGKVDTLLKYFDKKIMFNVSRGIIYAKNYSIAAEGYNNQISEARKALN
ncbi:MAG: Orotidine 5'-phosphate decarboxylase [Candidatus Heimdallarchaeota archaeon LC_2]|nr:MAG: Orotidine 5'-phosphate decarboxylase [Candidatus Heimdallarchaeota archaeon LC_2]